MLIDSSAELDTQANSAQTALWEAARRNQIEVVPLLIGAGADLNIGDKTGRTPLSAAAQAGVTW